MSRINLNIDTDFINIISLDRDDLFKVLLERLTVLYNYTDIMSNDNTDNGYIFARGTLPVCLCAHLDKVPYYKKILKISKKVVKNKDGKPIDYLLSSKQGIGGDDRCGVYAILSMLNKGFRPSVLFCMGEETGCQGSTNFTHALEKDALKDINAFIQIDRRGNKDCINYSDKSMELVNAICKFGFKYAYGSCTDISVLMPHFGISGVNLSSGYYHEHTGDREYISIKDFNYLLSRLEKILSSNIFNKKYVYKSYYNDLYNFSYSYSRFDNLPKVEKVSSPLSKVYSQLAINFDDNNKIVSYDDLTTCDYCGFNYFSDDLIEVDDANYKQVCPACAKELEKQGFVKCDCCNKLFLDIQTGGQCPFCGNDNNINF